VGDIWQVRKVAAAAARPPYFAALDPVAAFVSALQRAVGAVATGVWDRETHNLVAVWIIVTAESLGRDAPGISPWGVDPDVTASAVATIPQKLPAVFAYATNLAEELGMPVEVDAYRDAMAANVGLVADVQAKIVRHISEVEWNVPASEIVGQTPLPATTLDIWGNVPSGDGGTSGGGGDSSLARHDTSPLVWAVVGLGVSLLLGIAIWSRKS
jgi:hypothetical protein